jgi:lipopolysaccharide export system permease protein
MQVSTVFSAAGGLSPMLASWIPNFVFLAIGLYLLKMAPK